MLYLLLWALLPLACSYLLTMRFKNPFLLPKLQQRGDCLGAHRSLMTRRRMVSRMVDSAPFASGDVVLFLEDCESESLSFGVIDDSSVCYLASVFYTDKDGDMQGPIAKDQIRQELVDTVLLEDNEDLQLLYHPSHQEIDLSTVKVLKVIEAYPSVLKTESLPGGKLEDPHGEHSENVWLIKHSHISNLNEG